MEIFITYMLKVTAISAILFGYYLLFLRNKRFHFYNRFYLLATIVFSALAPLIMYIDLNNWTNNTSPIQMLTAITTNENYLENVVVTSSTKTFSFHVLFFSILFLVSAILLLRVGLGLREIYQLKKKSWFTYLEDVKLYITKDERAPFSFFKNIFFREDADLRSPQAEKIIVHEMVHVREKHSIDKVCINLWLCIFWANPIFWLMKRELDMIHEFIADNKTIENGDGAALASLLLHQTYQGKYLTLLNQFFHSPIKELP